MSDVLEWILWVNCSTCARACGTVQGGAPFVSKEGKPFCSAECMHVHEVYTRLCRWALRKAKRYPRREIDFTHANEVLTAYLRQIRMQRQI